MASKASVELVFDRLGLFDTFDDFQHNLHAKQGAVPQGVPKGPRGGASSKSRRNAREAIGRAARKTPEVMVKISGSGKESKQVLGHMTYITRNGKIEAENESGEILNGLDEVKELHQAWSEQVGKRRANGNQTVNVLFSMPAGTNPELLKEAVRDFGRERFSNHDYIFVLHTPETDPDPDAPPHPHVHMCVRMRGHDGKRLTRQKKDLQEWRELFAEKLREKGIEAAATPRDVRGVVRKATRQPVYQAEKAKRSTVKAATVREAAKAVLEGQGAPRPWEIRIAAKQKAIRTGWLDLADALDRTSASVDGHLAEQIRSFVKNMPAPLTERQAAEVEMRRLVQARAADSGKRSEPQQQPDNGPSKRPDQGRDR